jgi:hypothetical protein
MQRGASLNVHLQRWTVGIRTVDRTARGQAEGRLEDARVRQHTRLRAFGFWRIGILSRRTITQDHRGFDLPVHRKAFD